MALYEVLCRVYFEVKESFYGRLQSESVKFEVNVIRNDSLLIVILVQKTVKECERIPEHTTLW